MILKMYTVDCGDFFMHILAMDENDVETTLKEKFPDRDYYRIREINLGFTLSVGADKYFSNVNVMIEP